MIKERLRKILTKIFYVIFAVLVSITLWLYVEYTENDMQTGQIPNINVVFKNMDILNDRGLLISSLVTETLTLTIEASRSDFSRLTTPGVLTAEVDLSNVTSVGTQLLPYQFIFPQGFNRNDIVELGRSDSRITVIIDRIFNRQIPVKFEYTGGTARPELTQETVEFDPQWITIRGPEEIISKISHAEVLIFRENLAATFRDDLEFILIDEDGEVISDEIRDMIEYSVDTIHVIIPIKEIKDIALIVDLYHGDTTSEANTNWNIEPASIKVSGDPEALRGFDVIRLGIIDMTNFSLSYSEQYPILIPIDNVSNISGETVAMVRVDVYGMNIAHRSVTNIQTINVPPGLTANILTQSLDVRIRGSADDLSMVTSINILVVADLTDRNTGTGRVPARVIISGVDADLDPIGDYFVTVELTEITDDE